LSWITEKTRFFFDSLIIQQLDYPTIKILSNLNSFLDKKDLNEYIFYEGFYEINFELFLNEVSYEKEVLFKNNFLVISWKSLTYILLNKIKNYSNVLCSYYTGESLDIETQLYIKESALYYSSNSIKNLSERNYANSQNIINTDFDSNYIFKNNNFNEYKNIFLVNINLRTENAILNAKLRQKFIWDSKVNIYIIGLKYNLTYKYIQLGISSKSLLLILEGRHVLLNSLKKNKDKNLVLYNSNLNDCYKSLFHKSFFNYINIFYSNFQFSYLAKNASSLGAFDLSLDKSISKKSKINFYNKTRLNIIYYIQANSPSETYNSLFLKNTAHNLCIYQHSHGDSFFSFMDFFLPSSSYFEKEFGYYINCFGILRKHRHSFFLGIILFKKILIF